MVLGAKNLIVAASPDGILVSDKEKSDSLKNYVSLERHPTCEERRWGEYRIIDHTTFRDVDTLTKHLFLKAGASISYQRHALRDEIWTLINGVGEVVLDGQRQRTRCGEVVHIKKGCSHAILAVTDIHIIEVQIGAELAEEDIERFDWQW